MMRYFIIGIALLWSSAAGAWSCQDNFRTRVSTATVYQDTYAGNDANDGMTQTTALQSIQAALNCASGNFDVRPASWSEFGNVGYRPGITIQMTPTSGASPTRLVVPAFLDGLGQAAPITLRGDPTSRAGILSYNLYCANSLQGITAQNGGVLILQGFTIRGDTNCTLINTLEKGKIAVSDVFFGQGATGLVGALGAAQKSNIDITGNVTLIGSGFVAVFTAIEDGQFSFAPGASVCLDNAMNFGVMFSLMHASAWTQGVPITWCGPGLTTSTGLRYSAWYGSYIGFSSATIPGGFSSSDAPASYVAP